MSPPSPLAPADKHLPVMNTVLTRRPAPSGAGNPTVPVSGSGAAGTTLPAVSASAAEGVSGAAEPEGDDAEPGGSAGLAVAASATRDLPAGGATRPAGSLVSRFDPAEQLDESATPLASAPALSTGLAGSAETATESPVAETASLLPSATLRRDLRYSIADGAGFSLMVGMGENYLPAFVLAMGLGEIASGLVMSLPLLVGACLQLVSPYFVTRLGSNRKWVALCVLIQGLSFLPLVAASLAGLIASSGQPAPVSGSIRPPYEWWGPVMTCAVFSIAALYFGSGLAAGPAWNAWIETIVPGHMRSEFFAFRTKISQMCVLSGLLLGGVLLHLGKVHGYVLESFVVVFALAGLARIMSGRCLLQQSEAAVTGALPKAVPLSELRRRMCQGGSERMLLFFLAVQVAVQISGPYFSPYMLRQLRMSYLEFMYLLATSFVAKILTLPLWGRMATRYGARHLVWIGGLGIFPMSGLWLYAAEYWQILVVQVFAGIAWAAYELAMLLLFFETVRRDERTSILTLFNLGNAVALVVGSVIGGVVLKTLGESQPTYLVIFAVSALFRALSLVVLYWAKPAATR